MKSDSKIEQASTDIRVPVVEPTRRAVLWGGLQWGLLSGVGMSSVLSWGFKPTTVQAQQAPLKPIKFACVAPEGSLWVNLTKEWDRELRQRSAQRLRLQIFSGGILGEEIDTIRKMRAGQIQATGVTSVGVGEMLASTRALELPRLFGSAEALDGAVQALDGYYRQAFEQKGYTLLGFTEVGPIHLFTRKPIRKVEELNKMRMWVWEGDPLSEEIARAFGVSAVPLSLLNVLPSLQTGVLDGVYGSPLATMTMQWHRHLKYMTAEPLSFAVGAVVMDKRAFTSLPTELQALQLELGKKYCRQMVLKAREDNQTSVGLMVKSGIQVIRLDPSELVQFNEKSKIVASALSGKLYPPELLEQLRGLAQKSNPASSSQP